MSHREDVLGRVRSALSGVTPNPTPERPTAPTPDGVDVLALFDERVTDYRATVTRCDEARLGDVVAGLVDGRRCVVPPGLPFEVTGADVVTDGAPDRLSAADLDDVAVVVTAARVGIAVTGTVILDHTTDQGRRALTLVPDHHVCVVRADQVVHDVPDAVAVLDPRRPMTWISGPSATSDIELDRVEGVHGPRRLDVVLVGS